MVEFNRENRKKAVLEKYNSLNPPMNLKSSALRNLITSFIKNNLLLPEEKTSIRDYFGIAKDEDLYTVISNSKIKTYEKAYKAIQNFFTEKNHDRELRKLDLIEVLEIIVFKYDEEHNSKKKITGSSVNNFHKLKIHIAKKYQKERQFNFITINGDITSELGMLSMKDHFINLSYISHKDLKNRETLFRKEKESAILKINNNRTIDKHNLFQNYISSELLSSGEKIIITGNPGVGKSTYARWLCYQWTQNELYRRKLVIYIQLRDVNFKDKGPIVNYISEKYLEDTEVQILKKTINSTPENYMLILDGFDELENKNQKKLKDSIENLGHQINYILLSRPYGLLNNKLEQTVSFQIDGFDKKSIRRYISRVIKGQNLKHKTEEELLININKNKVLRDYAHVPLMLSYITFLYLFDSDSDNALKEINSIFDLHSEVFNCIIKHYNAKQGEQIDTIEEKSFFEFAYGLELNKTIVHNTISPVYIKVIERLCEIGVGTKIKYKRGNQFSFNTITLQEYLASRNLETITSDAFLYLSRDRFFWNFCLMIIGFLSEKGKTAEINEVLEKVKEKYNGSSLKYYKYAYFMFLAECKEENIITVLDNNSYDELIDFYKDIYGDSIWRDSVFETISKIYDKIPINSQRDFDEILLTKINRLFDSKNFFEGGIENKILYIFDLMKLPIISDHLNFIQSFIESLVKLFTEFNSIKKLIGKTTNMNHESEIMEGRLMEIVILGEYFLDNAFEEVSFQSLGKLKLELKALYEVCPAQLETYCHKLLNPINDYNNQLKKVNKIREKLIEYSRIGDKRLENYNDLIINKTNELVENVHLLTNLAYDLYIKDKKLTDLTEFTIKWIIKIVKEYGALELEGELEHDLINDGLIIMGYSDDNRSFDLLFDFIDEIVSNELSSVLDVNIMNTKSLTSYLTLNLKKELKNHDQKIQHRLFLAFNYCQIGNIDFTDIRSELLNLFFKIIKENKKQIENFEYIKENEYNVCNQLKTIAFLANNSYDIRYFLNKILESEFSNLNFLKSEIIFRLIVEDFPFYEENYWNFIFNYLEENTWYEEYFIAFIDNSRIHHFKSNIPYIYKLMEILFQKISEKKLNINEIEKSLSFLSNTLLMITSTKSDLEIKIVDLANKFLKDEEVLNTYIKMQNYPSNTTISDSIMAMPNVAYILNQYFNKNSTNYFIKYYKGKDNKELTSLDKEIIKILIEFFDESTTGIQKSVLEYLKHVLGDKFYAKFSIFIDEYLFYNIDFDIDHFNDLLDNKS